MVRRLQTKKSFFQRWIIKEDCLDSLERIFLLTGTRRASVLLQAVQGAIEKEKNSHYYYYESENLCKKLCRS